MDVLVLLVGATIVAVLAFAAGAAVVASAVVRRERARKATLGAAAAIARVGLEALPTRSSADILSGRITVVLGGLPYVLPVLPIRASAEWAAKVDERFASVAAGLEAAGNDTPGILALLSGHQEALLGMLREYDVNGILPDDEFVNEWATHAEILAGMVEVWRAANPLVAAIQDAAAEAATMAETSNEERSSSQMPTDGVLTT